MKKNSIIYTLAFSLLLTVGCKDDFLAEKRDLSGFNEEVFQDPLLAQSYVDFVYGMFQPANNGQPQVQTQAAGGSGGSYNDDFTQTTEELAGETNWNKPWAQISYTNAHAPEYFGLKMGNLGNNTWTRMKQINIFLQEVDKYGLPEDLRNKLKGQLLFWRAWQYFELLRMYGGVPIVLTAQNPIVMEGSTENEVPRSSSSETLEQIVKDLDAAITLLPGRWTAPADWGRITSGAAAALKGRALLTWASPQFNRTDEIGRWERAYNANLAAKKLLEDNTFGLYKEGSLVDGQAWGNMWFKERDNPEAVLIFGFNNVNQGTLQKNSGWEQAVRSRELLGGGSVAPTREMVDAFPMKDGKMPNSTTDPSTYTYDQNKFYKNRDPRFYKTFVYNGALWPYAGKQDFRQWTYRWKTSATSAYNKTTEANPNSSGIYLRKGTNPNASNSAGHFSFSSTDFMEIRFAEVVLNLAESAIGFNKLQEGLDGIKSIRERAGVENKDSHYGLSTAVGDRDKLFAAVLNERKVEFAYENKRFWDLRRWLLFDNKYGTVARLGMTALNGMRRTGYNIVVKNTNGTEYFGANDPLKRTANDGAAPVIEREPKTYPTGMNADQYLDYLYDNHFTVKVKDDLEKDLTWTFIWYDEYYFFGLHRNILNSSPYLEQTKGWNSLTGSANFDPLK